nr:ABC transporter ATP-binding protein [Actinopolymorpha cephalotaxi]
MPTRRQATPTRRHRQTTPASGRAPVDPTKVASGGDRTPWRAPSRRTQTDRVTNETCTADGNAVVVADLHKSYGQVRAVRGVSFTVRHGEIFALLGPNGAGKSTTLEILEGFRTRDSGHVEVLGIDPGDRAGERELRERIGLVLQDIAVEPHLTVRETIARDAGYYRAPRDVDEVIGLVGLTEQRRRKVRSLSGGQKRRLDLALGMIGDPSLLFLDEPTTGFDPAARQGAWELVRRLRAAGTTIVLTTHYMEEAQQLADRVAVITGGRIISEGTPATLGGRDSARARVRFALPDGCTLEGIPVAAGESVAGPERDELVTVETAEPTGTLHRLTGWALAAGAVLEGLTVERPSLEDVYLRLTGSSGTDAYENDPAGTDPSSTVLEESAR